MRDFPLPLIGRPCSKFKPTNYGDIVSCFRIGMGYYSGVLGSGLYEIANKKHKDILSLQRTFYNSPCICPWVNQIVYKCVQGTCLRSKCLHVLFLFSLFFVSSQKFSKLLISHITSVVSKFLCTCFFPPQKRKKRSHVSQDRVVTLSTPMMVKN